MLGQLKNDVNWVFGVDSKISFTDTGIVVGTSVCNNREISASFSNRDGGLLLYVTNDSINYEGPIDVKDLSNLVIDNGESIYTYSSNSQGAVFIPTSENPNRVYLIVTGSPDIFTSCGGTVICNNIYYSAIDLDENGRAIISEKNSSLGIQFADERLMTVKHANGKDWWILSHKMGDATTTGCSNTFIRLLFDKDGISVQNSQNVGSLLCDWESIMGEYDISRNGNFLSIAYGGDELIDIYTIDRCTGTLRHFTTLNMQYTSPYGVCFSPNERYLYLTSEDTLYQFDLQATGAIINSKVILDSNLPTGGQLQLGPDGKVYMAQVFKPYLGVINSPDSAGLACNYVYNGLTLAPGTYSIYGLPNMPNYNLGPLPIYQASAGVDTFYCQGDSTIKALPIGGDSLPNITYQWRPAPGIDTLTARTQLVKPSQSRWYYVTITDTSYIGPSCNSRLDSVYVEVRVCTGITETPTLQAKLYPNPTTGTLTVELPSAAGGIFTLYNLLGQRVLEAPLTSKSTVLDIDASPGIYLYQIFIDRHLQNGKLLVE
jgi:hypothetical protein